MHPVIRLISRLDALALRLWNGLDSAWFLRLSILLLPLIGGIASVKMGQDNNWDLRNYHWYNPFAFLNGKVGFDLNPAQFQSYFNPTIDLPYYLLASRVPTRVTAFVMGFVHSLNYILVLLIARRVLAGPTGEPGAAGGAGYRLPVLLAAAGCMGFAFLTQLGNTMGDNLTSLTVLGAIALLLREWPQLLAGGARAAMIAATAGLLIGAGTGLKLTNASYALALCLSLLTLRTTLWRRLGTAFTFGLGTLAGIGATAGHWYLLMYEKFGNPLFPQFNSIFKGPLAAPISVADISWLPRGWTEKLLWPFIFTFNPRRVIELPMTQIIWSLLYIGFLLLIMQRLRRLWLAAPGPVAVPSGASPGARMLLVFFAISYLLWLKLFSIYRYMVPLELLSPLVLWLLLHRICTVQVARVLGAWAIVLATVAGFPRVHWGHQLHGEKIFTVQVPQFADPAQSLVFIVHGDPPMSWLIPSFPTNLAFASLGSGFPESPGYLDRVNQMVAARKGPMYVMLIASGMPLGPRQGAAPLDPGTEQRQRVIYAAAHEILERYSLTFNRDSCIVYDSHAGGDGSNPYQLCEVRHLP